MLLFGIQPEGHCCACAERCKQELVRAEPAAQPADVSRLVGSQMMRPPDHLLLKSAAARFMDHDVFDRVGCIVRFNHWRSPWTALVGELCDSSSTSDPNRHAGLEAARITL